MRSTSSESIILPNYIIYLVTDGGQRKLVGLMIKLRVNLQGSPAHTFF